MFKLVHELHKKPHHVRDRIAFSTSALITLVILVVWVTHFHFTSPDVTGVVQESEHYQQAASPFASLKKNFEDIRQEFLGSVEPEQPTVTPSEASSSGVQSDIETREADVEYSFE